MCADQGNETCRIEECLRTNRLVEPEVYRFPRPPYTTSLRETTFKPFSERLNEYWKQRHLQSSTQGSSSTNSNTNTPPKTVPNTATYKILGLANGMTKDLKDRLKEKEDYYKTSTTSIGSGGGSSALNPQASTSASQLQSQVSMIASLGKGKGKGGGGGGGSKRCFEGKKIYLASDLDLSSTMFETIKHKVQHDLGGIVSTFHSHQLEEKEVGSASLQESVRGDSWNKRRKAEKELRESSFVIIRNREGWEYWLVSFISSISLSLSFLHFHLLIFFSFVEREKRLMN